jgi:hypothetical protein
VRVTDDRADIEPAALLHLRADPYVAGTWGEPVAEPMLGHPADQRGIRVARPHIASAAFYELPCDKVLLGRPDPVHLFCALDALGGQGLGYSHRVFRTEVFARAIGLRTLCPGGYP